MAALDRVKVLVLGDSGECPSPRSLRARTVRAGGVAHPPPPRSAGRRMRAAPLRSLPRPARPPPDWKPPGGSPVLRAGPAGGPARLPSRPLGQGVGVPAGGPRGFALCLPPTFAPRPLGADGWPFPGTAGTISV